MPSEKRRGPRAEAARKLQVTYVDEQGRERVETVSAKDASKNGCQVVLQFRCQVRTVIALRLTPAVFGSATVRYQNPTPRGYVTGLEFLSGLEFLAGPPA
jgi:hypothetical protein